MKECIIILLIFLDKRLGDVGEEALVEFIKKCDKGL